MKNYNTDQETNMSEIAINVSEQQFLNDIKIFNDSEVYLKPVNFIFARNGSGKSTFTSLIHKQMLDTHNVLIYDGYQKVFGENKYLNAFSLSLNATQNQNKIEKMEKEVSEKRKEVGRISEKIGEADSSNSKDLYAKYNIAKKNFNQKDKEIRNFYSRSAASIKNENAPQISKTTYVKRDFEKEIPQALQMKSMDNDEVKIYKETTNTPRKHANAIHFADIDLVNCLNSVNDTLRSKVEEKIRISRFSNDPQKIQFASKGLEIHEHEEGEICAFCGNSITANTFAELERYFSADEVDDLRREISERKKLVDGMKSKINGVIGDFSSFYPDFYEESVNLCKEIDKQKEDIINFLEKLMDALNLKESNLFSSQDEVEISIPNKIDISRYNALVTKNNEFDKDLNNRKEDAKTKLRLRAIKKLLDEFKYEVCIADRNSLQDISNNAEQTLNEAKSERQVIEDEIKNIEEELGKLKPNSEIQAINNINKKLTGSVEWKLDYYQSDDSGYYRISQEMNDGQIVYRGVSELSSGEKNIIALLYFLEKLEDIEGDNNSKIIVFDDPMNSNDSNMQYLIITELQKLYRGEYQQRYNRNKDYLVILTHNVHFYLNISPYGSFKDENKKTKYDKNNFYRIENKHFVKIENGKQDLKTNYDALWLELQGLANNGFANAMLNSMRRIIDTYIEFTGVNRNAFFKGSEQYIKLFNVNSHSAIDSLSAEAFTETTEELIKLFHGIFKDNGAEAHYKSHWLYTNK